VPVVDVIALVLGFGIALAVALLASGVADSPDPSMRWEGGVAVGFAALIFLGPFWIAQAVLTGIASFDGRGVSPWWLWSWLFLAPAIGMTPLSVALARLLKMLRPNRSDRD
jgi:MFS family permease